MPESDPGPGPEPRSRPVQQARKGSGQRPGSGSRLVSFSVSDRVGSREGQEEQKKIKYNHFFKNASLLAIVSQMKFIAYPFGSIIYALPLIQSCIHCQVQEYVLP